MENQLKLFVEKFFRNLGATVEQKENQLIIKDVPQAFEKYYGKISPYSLVFDLKFKNPENEYIDKSNYLIKSMSGYLEESGQTTLLKIDFDNTNKKQVLDLIKLPNSQIKRSTHKKKNNSFFRFTFHTSFQYLNENEKLINDLYATDEKIVNGNLKGYPIIEGKKSEIKVPDPKKAYDLAKDKLKEILQIKTEEVSEELNKRLDKEIERIESHFETEIKEAQEALQKNLKKMDQYKIEGDTEKILKQRKLIQGINEKLNPEDIQKEKQRAVQIEMQRHMLNINNKLFNTTLIYYPLSAYSILIANRDAQRELDISLDPLTHELELPNCDSCQKNLNEIFLCSNNHLVCKECGELCESCGRVYCKKCLRNKCEICGKKLCKDCYTRCSSCGKLVCKSHTKEDKATGKIFCLKCLKVCERCSQLKNPKYFKKSPKTKAEICEDCYRKEMQERTVKGVFG